ncbi:pistil-specific extensin-like protein, partial [Daubentonia madagascariensis]
MEQESGFVLWVPSPLLPQTHESSDPGVQAPSPSSFGHRGPPQPFLPQTRSLGPQPPPPLEPKYLGHKPLPLRTQETALNLRTVIVSPNSFLSGPKAL